MDQFSQVLQRVWAVVKQWSLAALETLGEMPVHCHRCHTEYKLREGKLGPLSEIREHRSTFHFFCDECKEALLAEYCFRCAQCGERHNLGNSSLCAYCLGERYPLEVKRVANQNARAWNHGTMGTLTAPQWFKTGQDFQWKCWRCGAPMEALDHYVPVALGGDTVAENCFPICKSCNSSKGATDPDDELKAALTIVLAHRRLRQYQNTRWPQLPSAPQVPSADIWQLPPSDSTNMWSL
ncbi:MAG: HNH endonuclease [Ktedonobacterales bacterium]